MRIPIMANNSILNIEKIKIKTKISSPITENDMENREMIFGDNENDKQYIFIKAVNGELVKFIPTDDNAKESILKHRTYSAQKITDIISSLNRNNSTEHYIGEIRLLPFRPTELPDGWYFCNGDRFDINTDIGKQLLSLNDTFKKDWNITIEEDTINIPNLFTVDGRGLFFRPVNNSDRVVGSIEPDTIKSHNHTINNSIKSVSITDGTENLIFPGTDFTGEYGENETKPINIGMTPSIFLGV